MNQILKTCLKICFRFCFRFCQCLTNWPKDTLYLYMASLAIIMSSADWHRWRRSFSSSLSISSFLSNFWLKNSIKFPVVRGETVWALRYHCTWNCILEQMARTKSPFDPVTRWATASFLCWKFCSLMTSSDKRCLLAAEETVLKILLRTCRGKFSFMKGLLAWQALITQHYLV